MFLLLKRKEHPEGCSLKNLLQTCKPDSVHTRRWAVIIYLAVALLQQSCCLPFSSGEPPFPFRVADIRGIAAHKVYPCRQLLAGTVSSYLTFSPLSRRGGRLFSVALSSRQRRDRPLTGVLLYAVRTFLSSRRRRAITWFAVFFITRISSRITRIQTTNYY